MFLTVHTAAGILLSEHATGPISAFLLGIISHFILDLVPHGDSCRYINHKNGTAKISVKGFAARATVDLIISIVLILLIFNLKIFPSLLKISFGIVGAILPDALIGIYELWKPKILKVFQNFHYKNHIFLVSRLKLKDLPSERAGLILQIIVFLIIFFLI